ncbi:hypothetical protein V6N13_147832 [Hibiscus sabdariffa]
MGDIRKGANEDPKDSCKTGGTAHSGRCPMKQRQSCVFLLNVIFISTYTSSPCLYHYNVADSRLRQHVEKGNEDGLFISCTASAANKMLNQGLFSELLTLNSPTKKNGPKISMLHRFVTGGQSANSGVYIVTDQNDQRMLKI